MNFFGGLYSYEVVMLILGVILFVVSIILLIRGRKGLAGYFVLAIAMVGYPSIRSIEYKDGAITIEKNTHELQQDPTNPQTRQALRQELAKIESRPVPDARTATIIARAQFALGNETAAAANLQKALYSDPRSSEALALKQKIDAIQQLDRLTAEVKSNPQNATAKEDLAKHLAQATREPIANPDALAKVAQAQAAMGNHQEAVSNAEKAIKINPNSPAAIELRRSLPIAPRQ